MAEWSTYLDIAIQACDQASQFLRKSFGDTKAMHHKEGSHYGVADDLEANQIIVEYLHSRSPQVAIYSEEGERNLDSELVWTIDPIDGTSNYRVGLPIFVTQLALLYKGEPVVSVIQAPLLELNFRAQKGRDASVNGDPISVSTLAQLNKAMLGLNKGTNNLAIGDYISRLGAQVRTMRLLGSIGLDLAYVASGKLDALINSGSDLYDYAPGILLVRQAGGVALTFEGKEWTCEDKSLIAGNNVLVSQIRDLITEDTRKL